MKHLFVPKDLMEQLEAKGFAEDCICGYTERGILISKVSYSSGSDCECRWDKKYDSEVRAATWIQIIDWFIEKYNIFLRIDVTNNPIVGNWYYEIQYLPSGIINLWSEDSIVYKTCKEAYNTAIMEALKLIPDVHN